MIQYFNSRDLSGKLDINLARWKRWTREFLPPDPLGGKQSGYARQFSLQEAFSVYLAGHLVAALGLSIPDTKKVLQRVAQWMGDKPMFLNSPIRDSNGSSIQNPQVHLILYGGLNRPTSCRIQETDDLKIPMDSEPSDDQILLVDRPSEIPARNYGRTNARILFITLIRDEFFRKLGI